MKSSFDTGIVPDDWRTANVTPIFKKGNRNKVENFRPVSLISQIGKLFQMIIRDSIVGHLENKNSSVDEIANVNFFYDDIAHVVQNTKKVNLFLLTN